MRKITNKRCLLSKTYSEELTAWEDGTLKDKSFENYNSSNFRHYCSIKMELLRCQDGLCAYTEKNLCPPEYYDENNWQNGSYNEDCKKLTAAKGQLDHFDSSLKNYRPWDWENLLVADSDVNTKKLQKVVDYKFKPDNPNYDPLDWLDYDYKTHRFVPKNGLSESNYNEVINMIEALGINAVWNDRRRYLSDKLDDIQIGIKSVEEINIDEFPTAFQFCLKKLKL